MNLSLILIAGVDAMKKVYLAGIFVLILGNFIMGAAGAELLPSQFYGNVTIDGEPAPAGTHITEWINGQECGSVLLGSRGIYGQIPGTLDPSFSIFCSQTRENDRILFFINGQSSGEKCDFVSGGLTRLDLTLDPHNSLASGGSFSGNAPLPVQFTDGKPVFPRSMVWYFGDSPEPSFAQDPVHIFIRPGIYTILQLAANETGIIRTEKAGYISVYPTGDINNNWNVDFDDVMAVVDIAQGNLEPDRDADVNRDGSINETDVSLMMYYCTGR